MLAKHAAFVPGKHFGSVPRRAVQPALLAAMIALFLLAMLPRTLTYGFSLPYVDHPDEPAAYLKALEMRGLFDLQGYHQGYPPAYILLEGAVQIVAGGDMAVTIRLLRWLSALADSLVAVLIALGVRRFVGARPGAIAVGWVAGTAWAVGPLLVEHGIYAIPDPLVTLCTMLALHAAVIAAQEPRRRDWCVASVAFGLLAVALKYNALPALVPGGLVAFGMLFTRERERALRLLAAQLALCMAAAFLLLGVYRADLINTPGTSDVVRGQGLANVLNVERIASNLGLALRPIPPLLLILLATLPLVGAAQALHKSGGGREGAIVTGLSLPIVLGVPWIASAFVAGETDWLRFVLPATPAALILVGGSLWYAAALGVTLLGARAGRLILTGVVLYGALALLEPAGATAHLVEDRQREDWRVALRAWTDASLEPGLILVSYDNHKTFNPFWGGLTGRAWFDWLVVEDFASLPPDRWRSERGAVYAVLPYALVGVQDDVTSGWLHLRDFVAPPNRRGPEVSVYRLWEPQTALRAEFGGQIALVGYDLAPEQFEPGDVIRLRPYWQALVPVEGDYSAFLHLVRESENTLLAQADGSPSGPTRPTLTWDTSAETLIGALFELDVPADVPPGKYSLRLGLYDYQTGARLQLADGSDGVEIVSVSIAD